MIDRLVYKSNRKAFKEKYGDGGRSWFVLSGFSG